MLLNDYELPTQEFIARPMLRIESRSLSGNTSATDSALHGRKKEIRCSFVVPYSEADKMRQVVSLAEAVDDSGEQVVYDVVSLHAQAFGIKRVVFDGDLVARPDGERLLWSVSLTLVERNSAPEREEMRRERAEVAVQSTLSEVDRQQRSTDDLVADITGFSSLHDLINQELRGEA